MPKFRKKPVVIEAVQYNNLVGDFDEIKKWMQGHGSDCADKIEWASPLLLIPTLEGVMEASPRDYIIRGVNGEYYPCKPDIFAKTYDPA